MGQAPIDVASTFFWIVSTAWVSDWWRGFLISGSINGLCSMAWALLMVSDWWLYWWFLIGGPIDRWHGFDGLCMCVALLMVWWFVFMCGFVGFVFVCVCVCVCGRGGGALCVWWWVWIDWSVYHGSVCVTLCVEPELKVKGEREAIGKPRKIWQSCLVWKKWQLEINNKERLKNNILIKIKFWDAERIVKWYGISNKITF